MLPLLNEFKDKLLRDGLSPMTIDRISDNIIYFSRYLTHEDMRKVSPKDIERYKIYIMTEYLTKEVKPLSEGSILLRLLALKPYFKFLVENRNIFFDPTLNLEIPKRKKSLPDYIPTEEDIEALLNKPDISTYMGIRDRTIIELMYTCPLRNKEIRELTINEIDLKDRYIYPKRAKHGRECGIPIVDSLYQALEKYLEISRPRLAIRSKAPIDILFLTERGEPFKRGTLGEILEKYREESRLHPHSIRHACATHMLKHGAKIRYIQVLLGHRNLTSTQVYTRLTANDLKDLHKKHHPREKRYRMDIVKEEIKPIYIVPLLNEFKGRLLQEGMAPNIINKTLKAIVFFSRQAAVENMRHVTKSDIERYRLYLESEFLTHEGRRFCNITVILMLRSLKEYFKFLLENRYIASDPTSDLEVPDKGRPARKILPTKSDIEEFASKPDPYSYVGIRDRALLRLCWSCPLRTLEYKDLNARDVDLEKRRLYPSNSGDRYKEGLPLDEEAHKALDKYLKVSRPVFLKKAKASTDRLFLNEWGDPFNRGSIFEVFYKYRGEKRISPFSMRYVRAIEMLRSGSKPEDVIAFLGLKSLKSLQCYNALIASDLSNLQKSCYSRSKLYREGNLRHSLFIASGISLPSSYSKPASNN